MSSIKYKGQTYSGASSIEDASHVIATDASGNLTTVQALLDAGAGIVELTQAQYDALPTATKNDGRIYAITDGTTTAIAEDVRYDNTDSGLTASNVQDAVDEITTTVDEITTTVGENFDDVFGDFASIETSSTASKAYAVGDYLVNDGGFYRVIDDIAQGDTITPNTNVTKTTVSEWLLSVENMAKLNHLVTDSNGSLSLTGGNGILSSVSNGSYRIGLHIGVGGGNHGIYHWGPNDSDMGWLIFSDTNNDVFIKNSMLYPKGTGTYMCSGYMSTGTQDIFFTVPYLNAAGCNRNITIDSVVVRQNGGYLIGSGDGPSAAYGTAIISKSLLGFNIVLRNTSGYGGSNNAPLGILANVTIT